MRFGDRTYRCRKIRVLRSDAGRGKVRPQLCGQGGRPSLAFLRGFHLANCISSSNPRDLAGWCAERKGSENCSGKWAGPRPPQPQGRKGERSDPEIRLARLHSLGLGMGRQPRCIIRQGPRWRGSVARKGTKSSPARPPTSGSYCSSSLGLYRTLVPPERRVGGSCARPVSICLLRVRTGGSGTLAG